MKKSLDRLYWVKDLISKVTGKKVMDEVGNPLGSLPYYIYVRYGLIGVESF